MDYSGWNDTLMFRQRSTILLLLMLGLLMLGCSSLLRGGRKLFHPFSDYDVELCISLNDTVFSVADVADYTHTGGYCPPGYSNENHVVGLGYPTGPPLNGPKLTLTVHNHGEQDVRVPVPAESCAWSINYPMLNIEMFHNGRDPSRGQLCVVVETEECSDFEFVIIPVGDSVAYPSCIDILDHYRYYEATVGWYELWVELENPCGATGAPPALTGKITSNRVMFKIVDSLPDRFGPDTAANSVD